MTEWRQDEASYARSFLGIPRCVRTRSWPGSAGMLQSIRTLLLVGGIFLAVGASGQGTYRAAVGEGTHYIHWTQVGSNCGGPLNNSSDFTVFWGALTLVSDSTAMWSESSEPKLDLLKVGAQWIPGSVTATGPTSLGEGQSTYVSTLSANGIVITVETGSFNNIYSDGSTDAGTVSSTETIDLNSGAYTWVRTHNESTTGSCPGSWVETQHRTATLPVLLKQLGPGLSITSPADGALPRSQFVALTGSAEAGNTVTIQVSNGGTYSTSADETGFWEQVVRTGPGAHVIQAIDGTSTSNVIRIFSSPPHTTQFPGQHPDYALLKNADILLGHQANSEQDQLYGPVYTHAALFVGGDVQGTPLIAEAVPPRDAKGLGQVRSVPIEQSCIYTEGYKVDLFRSASPMSLAQRTSTSLWAKSVVNTGRKYWPISTFSHFAVAYGAWRAHQKGLLDGQIKDLDGLKFETDRFICSTLVWRAYYEGTGHASEFDLSTPNRSGFADPEFQTDGIQWPRAFIRILQPHFVFPDTIFRSGKVSKVAE